MNTRVSGAPFGMPQPEGFALGVGAGALGLGGLVALKKGLETLGKERARLHHTERVIAQKAPELLPPPKHEPVEKVHQIQHPIRGLMVASDGGEGPVKNVMLERVLDLSRSRRTKEQSA